MKRAVVTCLALGVVASVSIAAPARSTHDLTPPETSITAGPALRTTDTTPRFAFSSSEKRSRFVCKRDGGRFKPCTSPKTLKPLPYGRHGFYVRAIDEFGNKDATAAAHSFKVVRR
ncbi:MAG TPA: hypothetical protein VHH72_06800 [Solirubrobacterales bacterium]|jgi:hypothetical protein|nr:hypothetical protein [Solirubrobacterales bacterium]